MGGAEARRENRRERRGGVIRALTSRIAPLSDWQLLALGEPIPLQSDMEAAYRATACCTEPPATQRIRSGDCIIVVESSSDMRAVALQEGGVLRTRFGQFPHTMFIGESYGKKLQGDRGGFLFALPLHPKLWALAFQTRTQVLFLPDRANIIAGLGLAPGMVVVEAGTGSGVLTHALADAVGGDGRICTFEYNIDRARAAAAEFDLHGLTQVSGCQRDVCEHGFTPEPDCPAYAAIAGPYADALFLDVPQPWTAVAHVARALKPGGTFCSFSPCIEQVAKTVDAALALGFVSPRTLECISRPYEIKTGAFSTPEFYPPTGERTGAHGRKRARGDEATLASTYDLTFPQGVVAAPFGNMRAHTGYLTYFYAAAGNS
jgi:tRNA (adenine57-N1/adenine58-N1)-methyltransferase